MHFYDTLIIGGGQSALATAYFLKKAGVDFLLLDEQEKAGGAWLHAWESLHLFSPSDASSLPGWLMPKSAAAYPSRNEVISYLQQYENRYSLPAERPVQVLAVHKTAQGFWLETNKSNYYAKTVVSATGTYRKPFIPDYPGQEKFKGLQLHSADYQQPTTFKGKTVMVVGGGNSGAQILAEVATVATTVWVTKKDPSFLPDEVDGRYLFSIATKIYEARKKGETYTPKGSLGDIVMVDSVLEAREQGVLKARSPFEQFTEKGVVWADGSTTKLDAVIWCTGFRPALEHLAPLNLLQKNDNVNTEGTRATELPGLWLVGYGGWTGFASATLIGVGRSARQTASEIKEFLQP